MYMFAGIHQLSWNRVLGTLQHMIYCLQRRLIIRLDCFAADVVILHMKPLCSLQVADVSTSRSQAGCFVDHVNHSRMARRCAKLATEICYCCSRMSQPTNSNPALRKPGDEVVCSAHCALEASLPTVHINRDKRAVAAVNLWECRCMHHAQETCSALLECLPRKHCCRTKFTTQSKCVAASLFDVSAFACQLLWTFCTHVQVFAVTSLPFSHIVSVQLRRP